MSEYADARDYWENHHLQSTRLDKNDPGQGHRKVIAKHVLAHGGTIDALEFGCNTGRNLAVIKEMCPTARLTGIDMSHDAIKRAREVFPDINFIHGDESALALISDYRHNVVFTCSVLDHIPEPHWRLVYDELVRVSKEAVILFEPWDEGQDYEMRERGINSPPFTYVHDYLGHDAMLQKLFQLDTGDPSSPWVQFGKYYHMFRRDK